MFTGYDEYTDIIIEDKNAFEYYNSFIYDYEKYINDFGFIPANYFIKGWNCINSDGFSKLKAGDIVYDYRGESYEILKKGISHIECTSRDTFMTYNPSLYKGEIYSDSVTHKDYRIKIPIKHKERQEKICPILITKTNQVQS